MVGLCAAGSGAAQLCANDHIGKGCNHDHPFACVAGVLAPTPSAAAPAAAAPAAARCRPDSGRVLESRMKTAAYLSWLRRDLSGMCAERCTFRLELGLGRRLLKVQRANLDVG